MNGLKAFSCQEQYLEYQNTMRTERMPNTQIYARIGRLASE